MLVPNFKRERYTAKTFLHAGFAVRATALAADHGSWPAILRDNLHHHLGCHLCNNLLDRTDAPFSLLPEKPRKSGYSNGNCDLHVWVLLLGELCEAEDRKTVSINYE
jgi:hypothetical protein